MSGAPRILRVSFTIFISSSLYPFSVIGELCENRLNAYCSTNSTENSAIVSPQRMQSGKHPGSGEWESRMMLCMCMLDT